MDPKPHDGAKRPLKSGLLLTFTVIVFIAHVIVVPAYWWFTSLYLYDVPDEVFNVGIFMTCTGIITFLLLCMMMHQCKRQQ